MNSVLQDWVMELGLRHQGVLLTGIRGCDTAPKNDPSKDLARCFRAAVLNAHCGDAKKARTFIEYVHRAELVRRMDSFRRNCDQYPHHYVMHVTHAAQIVGIYHPDQTLRHAWFSFYVRMVEGLHLVPEPSVDMHKRLNADEATFAERDAL